MPVPKVAETFLASQSLPAGNTVTGAAVDLRTKFGTVVHTKVTNGGTGPSTPPEISIEVSNDNFVVDVHDVKKLYAGTGANQVTEHEIRLVPEEMWARVKFKAGTGQASTVAAAGSSVVSLS